MPLIIFDKLPFLLLLFARQAGLFIFSPLFVKRGVILPIRFALTFIFSLILMPHLLQNKALLYEFIPFPWYLVLKELIVGYLLGTLLAFMLEAALLAGRWFAASSGFSATELLAPQQNVNQPLFVTLFTLILIALLFALESHHLAAYFLLDSYSFVPLHHTPQPSSLFTLSQSAQLIFTQGFNYLLLPLFLLLSLIILFSLLSKFFPEIPIFWVGLPLQLFFGYLAFSLMLLFIVPIIEKAFIEILKLSFLL